MSVFWAIPKLKRDPILYMDSTLWTLASQPFHDLAVWNSTSLKDIFANVDTILKRIFISFTVNSN